MITITKDRYGIHTFILSCGLNFDKYRELKLILQRHITAKNETRIKSCYFASIGYKGIDCILEMANGFARIYLIINPINLLSNEYLQERIFSCPSSCKKMLKKLNKALSNIGMTADMFSLERIDLCANFPMPAPFVEEYIKIAHRSLRTDKLIRKYFNDPVKDSHSMYAGFKTFDLKIYDKQFEINRRTNKDSSYTEFGELLRIEISLRKDSVYNAMRSLSDKSLLGQLSFFVSQAQILMLRYIEKFYEPGDYHTLEVARRIVQNAPYRKNTVNGMLNILESRRSIDNTFSEINSDMYSLKCKFSALNVNP